MRGTEAERVQWTQRARRSVGNRKERVRDYASSPEVNEATVWPQSRADRAPVEGARKSPVSRGAYRASKE